MTNAKGNLHSAGEYSAESLFWKVVLFWLNVINYNIDLFTDQLGPQEFPGFEQPRHVE